MISLQQLESHMVTVKKKSYYLHVTARFLPNFTRNDVDEDADANFLSYMPNYDIYNAKSVARLDDVGEAGDVKWTSIQISDHDGPIPICYIESYTPLVLGNTVKINDRTCMNDAWLYDYMEYLDWDAVLETSVLHLHPTSLQSEQVVQHIIQLDWVSDVDWETGNDEGYFGLGKNIISM